MNFVRFKEYNDWEGESWYFYLQLTGNEEAIKRLAEVIKEYDENEEYELSFTAIPENEVDIVVKHTSDLGGYMDLFTKVEGHFKFEKLLEDIESQGISFWAENIRKGRIVNYFDTVTK